VRTEARESTLLLHLTEGMALADRGGDNRLHSGVSPRTHSESDEQNRGDHRHKEEIVDPRLRVSSVRHGTPTGCDAETMKIARPALAGMQRACAREEV
jgi:hypothetical protein